jgi:hypothetical protein
MTGWLRFVVPSVCDLVFILLVFGISWGPLAKGLLGDAGIGWHIRTGQLILSTHSIPRVDPFSLTMHGKTWYAWEWLYDAGVGAIHHAAGLNGVVFFSALVIALTFALVLRMMLARGPSLPVAVILLLPAVSASTIHFLARPHVLSWLFTVIWFGLLERFEEDGKTRLLLWLPVLTLLWVNLHGAFVVGFILLAIYFVSALVNWLVAQSEERRELARLRMQALGLAGILSFVATFGNPYGYKLHIHVYQYLTDRFLMDHIDEFLSPNFHGLPQRCFAGLVLLAVVAVAARKKVGLSHLLVMLFAIYAGLYATRNIPVSSMLLVLIVGPQISAWLQEMAGSREIAERVGRLTERLDSFGRRMIQLDSSLRGHLWPVLVVLLGLWMCEHGGRLGSARVLHACFDDARFPVQATDFLERNGNREAVFCPDKWGGYLIYRLYPQTLVAVDDRHDLYGAEFLKRYLKIMHGESGWEASLEDMRAGWVLVPTNSLLASLLEGTDRWTMAYRDDTSVVYRHSDRDTRADGRGRPSLH